MTASVQERRKPKGETERLKAERACDRHLEDLRQAYGEPPADAAVSTRGLPKFVAPILELSYCTSPAALCAELAAEPPAEADGAPPGAPNLVAPIPEQLRRASPAALAAAPFAEAQVSARGLPELAPPIPERPLSAELADLAEEAGR